MRIPSRKMPEAQAPKIGWLGVILALGLIALPLAALAGLWWPLAILVPVAVVGISWLDWRRDRQIAESREGESICQFTRGFDCRHVDTRIIRAVYEQFSGRFPLRPSDRLKEDLRIDGDDLDFDATEIAQRTGRSLAGWERNPIGKIGTLHDLVMFFHHQPLVGASQMRQQV